MASKKVRAMRGVWVNDKDPDKKKLIPPGTEFDPSSEGIPDENVELLKAVGALAEVPEAKEMEKKAAEAGVTLPSPTNPKPAG